jgi:hypothetical protein
MSASPFSRSDARPDRGSDAPIAFDLTDQSGSTNLPAGWGSLASRIPQSWIGMSGYLVAGVFLGLILIVALSLSRGDANASAGSAGIVTDNVVHLHSAQIGSSCWRGASKEGPARVTVSLEVGLDGKVRNAIASGESATMRGCVEAHVKSWEFLPQATSSQMVLPFEISSR